MEHAWGGEIFVPKIPSYKILDVAQAIGPECEHKVIGIRAGEKIHEEMITSSDAFFTYDIGKYYTIVPQKKNWDVDKFVLLFNATKVQSGFSYNSESNDQWISVEEIRVLIKQNIDPTFE
tara:strand:- start:1166 stop:1525 length:360 start_codon:yes stop_codon:yes gene_type:complete